MKPLKWTFHFSESGILGVVWCLLSTVRKISLVLSSAHNQSKNKPYVPAKVGSNLPNRRRHIKNSYFHNCRWGILSSSHEAFAII